jgi:hypothetical protein
MIPIEQENAVVKEVEAFLESFDTLLATLNSQSALPESSAMTLADLKRKRTRAMVEAVVLKHNSKTYDDPVTIVDRLQKMQAFVIRLSKMTAAREEHYPNGMRPTHHDLYKFWNETVDEARSLVDGDDIFEIMKKVGAYD